MGKLKAFWAKLNADPSSLWEDSKAFVIIFGAIILVLKFKSVLVDVIVSGGKSLFDNTTQKSDDISNKENQDNENANALINDANQLPNNEPPVGDDWNLKKVIAFFLLMSLACDTATAGCNWKDIKKNTDNTYTYSHELFICTGQLVEDNKTKDQQITDLKKAASLKDLSVQEADKKAKLWNEAAANLENRLQQIDKIEQTSSWLYFLLGVGVTGVAAYTAAKISGR